MSDRPRPTDDELAALVEQWRPYIRIFAERQVADPDERDDIEADLLAEIWRVRHRWDPRRGRWSTWLTMMLRARCGRRKADAKRLCRHAPEAPMSGDLRVGPGDGVPLLELLPDQRPLPDAMASERDLLERLEAASWRYLTPLQREAVWAHVHGVSQADLAEQRGVTRSAVNCLARHGRRKLAAVMEEQ